MSLPAAGSLVASSQGREVTKRTCRGQWGPSVDLALSLAEEEEWRQVVQQEDCATVLATDGGDGTEAEGTPQEALKSEIHRTLGKTAGKKASKPPETRLNTLETASHALTQSLCLLLRLSPFSF